MAGKGSTPRPTQIPRDEFTRRWGAAFGGKPIPIPESDQQQADKAVDALLDKQEREITND